MATKKQTKKTAKKSVKKSAKKSTKKEAKDNFQEEVEEINEICSHCEEEIDPKEKLVYLVTANQGEMIEELYYHFDCWKEYWENQIKERIEKQQTARNIFSGKTDKKIGMDQISNLANSLGFLVSFLPKPQQTEKKQTEKTHFQEVMDTINGMIKEDEEERDKTKEKSQKTKQEKNKEDGRKQRTNTRK